MSINLHSQYKYFKNLQDRIVECTKTGKNQDQEREEFGIKNAMWKTLLFATAWMKKEDTLLYEV